MKKSFLLLSALLASSLATATARADQACVFDPLDPQSTCATGLMCSTAGYCNVPCGANFSCEPGFLCATHGATRSCDPDPYWPPRGRLSALATFSDGFEMVDVTGDTSLVFTGVISTTATQSPGVLVASRVTGAPVGSLTPPPAGWGNPSALAITSYVDVPGRDVGDLLVVDNGALPPFSHATIYRYRYKLIAGVFTSRLLDSHALPVQSFPPVVIDGVGYVGGVAKPPGGQVALADALDGAIWVCGPSLDDGALAMADPDFAPAPAPPAFYGVGRAPGGGVRAYELGLANGLMPGLLNVTYVDVTDEVCGERAAPPGGIFCVARSVLVDLVSSPYVKAKRVLVAPTVGLSDASHGVAYDHWNPCSPWLYWVRSLADAVGGGSNFVRRVSVITGAIEDVAESTELMDFSTGLQAIPPLVPGSPTTNLAVAMGQEECNGAINPSLGGVSTFVSPSIIAHVKISSH